ncbi:MAG: hypothetical protein KZQ99_04670 [Candidatus Thiodiazotropha sp. (ex Dulcina madagascariensis)]|nr:hypothetical protein [Candidatus Thiodiazotropha sp. (ex Dulcina madagascariensis)]
MSKTTEQKPTADAAGPVDPLVNPTRQLQKHEYCHTCGAVRSLAAYRDSISIHDIINMDKHREIQRGDGRMYEMSPQLIVHVGIWRNGGSDGRMFICDDCLRVGLRYARDRINGLLGEG